nr:GrBNV_gp36-like protein [Apis mellifera nudivirus]
MEQESTSDILDSEPIAQCDIAKYGVIINIPTLYIAASENGVSDEHVDQSTENLRVIPIDRLDTLMRLSLDIPHASYDRLIELWEIMVEQLIRYNGPIKDVASEDEILKFLSWASRAGRSMDVGDDYVDTTNNVSITFDIIRHYVADEKTGMLKMATAENWHDGQGNIYSFYSQLADNTIERVRKEKNDTDLMRYHYCLQTYEKILRFERGYVFDRTIRLANLALLYLCLIAASRPIEFLSSNDLKSSYLSYMIDVVVRSRVIGAWQREPAGRIMINDLVHNYDDTVIMVQLCRLTTSRDRVKFMLNRLNDVQQARNAVQALSYEAYEELLEQKAKRVINNVTYYVFDASFLIAIASMQGFNALRSMYKMPNNNNNEDDGNNELYAMLQ